MNGFEVQSSCQRSDRPLPDRRARIGRYRHPRPSPRCPGQARPPLDQLARPTCQGGCPRYCDDTAGADGWHVVADQWLQPGGLARARFLRLLPTAVLNQRAFRNHLHLDSLHSAPGSSVHWRAGNLCPVTGASHLAHCGRLSSWGRCRESLGRPPIQRKAVAHCATEMLNCLATSRVCGCSNATPVQPRCSPSGLPYNGRHLCRTFIGMPAAKKSTACWKGQPGQLLDPRPQPLEVGPGSGLLARSGRVHVRPVRGRVRPRGRGGCGGRSGGGR